MKGEVCRLPRRDVLQRILSFGEKREIQQSRKNNETERGYLVHLQSPLYIGGEILKLPPVKRTR